MNNYDKNKESSYIRYLDANNLYGWANLYEYVNLPDLHSDLPFLPEKNKN